MLTLGNSMLASSTTRYDDTTTDRSDPSGPHEAGIGS